MIQCKHCPRTTRASETVARVIQGWRLYTGTTQDGRPLEDVVCPICAGTQESTGWNFRCVTCDWSYREDWEDDVPLERLDSVGDLERELRYHECEPILEVQAPDTDVWIQHNTEAYDKLKDQWKLLVVPLDSTPTSP